MTLLKWLIGIATFLLWMAWAGAFCLGDRDRNGRLGPTLRLAGCLIGLLLFVLVLGLLSAVGQIPAGTRGVVLRFGAPTTGILPSASI